MKMTEKRRFSVAPPPEIVARAEGEPATITGYAAVFNQATELWGFKEQIAPGAFARALSENQDVRALLNHDPNLVLGRTKNDTLTLEEDDHGLKYTVQVADTSAGRDALELIRRGDVDQSSFAFSVRTETWEKAEQLVTIDEIEMLYDVSPVTYPAYQGTSVSARSALAEAGIDIEAFSRILGRSNRGLPLDQADIDLAWEFIKQLRSALPGTVKRDAAVEALKNFA